MRYFYCVIEHLLIFSLATVGLAVSPGPDNIYVLSQAMAHGTRSGLATTAGLISGCIVHTTLLAFGISAVIAASPKAFWAIKILGASYLLYLAYQVYKSEATVSAQSEAPKKTYFELFKQGVIMNLINPKVILFFLAFFPGALWDTSENTVMQFYVLGITFMLVSFVIFSAIAFLAGYLSKQLKNKPGVGLFFKWLQIAVFVGIAVFILIPE